MALLTIEERAPAGPGKSPFSNLPFLRLGFRPFYLLAAVFAALSVPLWIAHYYGWTTSFPNVNMF